MAKWDFLKNQGTFLAKMLIKALTSMPEDKQKEYFAHRDKVTEKIEGEERPYNIQFIVDGFEFPLEDAFQRIEEQLDDMIERRAIKLLDERLAQGSEQLDKLRDLVDDAASKLQDRLEKELHITFDDDTWHDE